MKDNRKSEAKICMIGKLSAKPVLWIRIEIKSVFSNFVGPDLIPHVEFGTGSGTTQLKSKGKMLD